MTIEVRHPASRSDWLWQRSENVGASAVGCLLGSHDYWTPFALWAQKSGLVEDDPEETPAMQRGRLLERVAVQLMQEQHPDWIIQHNDFPGGRYFVDNEVRLASTPDAFVTAMERPGFGAIQIKSVEASIFRRKWRNADTGETEPPLWIAVQAMIDAHLSGASWAAVAPLVVSHGLECELIDVPLHAGVIAKARAAVAEFWTWVAEKRQPPLDYARDGRVLDDLYDPDGEVLDMTTDNYVAELADERERLSTGKTVAEKRLKAIKSELLDKLNGASAVHIPGGRIISVKRIERAGYTVKPTDYLDLRIRAERGE